MSSNTPRHLPSSIKALAAAGAIAFGLSACYVIPIDPHTGQPYAQTPRDTSSVSGAAPAYSSGYPASPAYPNSSTYPTGYVAAPQAPLPSQLAVRLYPLNAQANRAGLLAAVVTDNNAGHGTFTVPYLGDTLQGESTRVDSSYAAFGHVYQDVMGPSVRAFTGRRGIANAHGARGVNAQCEYLLIGPGSGTGVCQFSDGANYQMHFGG